jgi:hypothetical protein
MGELYGLEEQNIGFSEVVPTVISNRFIHIVYLNVVKVKQV